MLKRTPDALVPGGFQAVPQLPRTSETKERQAAAPGSSLSTLLTPPPRILVPRRLAAAPASSAPPGFLSIVRGLRTHMTLPPAALPSPLPPNQQSRLTYHQAADRGHLCHHPRSATRSSWSLVPSSLVPPRFLDTQSITWFPGFTATSTGHRVKPSSWLYPRPPDPTQPTHPHYPPPLPGRAKPALRTFPSLR